MLLGTDNVAVLPVTESLVKTLVERKVEHCVGASGIVVRLSDSDRLTKTILEGLEISQPDESTADSSTGIGYEIDSDVWNLLRSIESGDQTGLDELHIKWLSEAGLIVVTASGRAILTDDAKTWISSSPQ